MQVKRKKQVFNPYLPLDTYIPDGEPHVFGDRVYLFGSHDQEGGESYCLLDYVGWSAPVDDLSDWTCSGVIYSPTQDPLYGDKMKYLYAPDVVRGNDGRYYLYYCMAGWRGKGGYSNPISVAVCDAPDGRYEYLGVVRDMDGKPLTRYVCFDPAVINDNGTIRLYYGSNYPWFDKIPFRGARERAISIMSGRTQEQLRAVPEGVMGAYHVTLADDMLTITSLPRRIDNCISGEGYKAHSFFEGASIRKIGDTYYFVWSSIKNHELCYATSKHPDGNFVYGGTIVSNGDVGYKGRKDRDRLNHTGTTHGGIERVNGKWYVFYHRLTHNSDYSRQACAEPIEIAPDGSIAQVEVTSCGLNGAPLRAEGSYPAAICCNLTNGRMKHGSNGNRKSNEPCVTSGSGERFVTNITGGTVVGYKYFDYIGETTVSVTYRGAGGALSVGTEWDTPLVEIALTPSEKWVKSTAVTFTAHGRKPLYFKYRGKGKIELLEFSFKENAE